jgi:phage terminase large subunit-like protein
MLATSKTNVTSPQLQADALAIVYPEPEWIARAADEHGFGWARIAWQRSSAVPGAWFDYAKADAVVAQWSIWFSLTVGRFAGVPFRLSLWQEIIVRLLVGWKHPIEVLDPLTGLPVEAHVRIYRELRLWVPRKNGKSEFLASLALYFWYFEALQRGEGYCFAKNEDQAKIPFTKMADIVGLSPELSAGVQVHTTDLWCQEFKTAFVLLTGKAGGKHGKAPTVTLGDEMHEWVSRELADTLRQGEASLEPIRLYASTAGLKQQGTGYGLWEESLKILDGRVQDTTKLIVIFAAPEDADWTDEETWRLANPSIGLSPTLATLREDANEARESATALAAFRRYRLNQWVEDLERWIPLPKWDACAPDKLAWLKRAEQLAGRSCVLAFDSTWNYDFASMCLRFDPLNPDEQPLFLWKHWLPSETIEERMRKERLPLDKWVEGGALASILGGVFVLDWAIKEAKSFCQQFKVTKIGWDSWSAKEFYTRLVAEGIAEDLFQEMRFGTGSLGAATKEFERRILAGQLDHGGNPIVRWMIGHCHVRYDENMNFVPAKKTSAKSIDGVFTAVMCEALALTGDEGPNVDEWLRGAVMR